jgi:hypothetical protein
MITICRVQMRLTSLGDVNEPLRGKAGENPAYPRLTPSTGKPVYLPARQRSPSACQDRQHRRVEGRYQDTRRTRDVDMITLRKS